MRPATSMRARDEAGFTVVEMMVGSALAMTVLLAALVLLDTSVRLTGRATDRVDATQRGRQAMDIIVRDLRSQVCLASGTPAVVAADPWSVTFYADLGDGNSSAPPNKRVLTYNDATGTITQDVYVGTGEPPATTYPAEPTRRTVILADVGPDPSIASVGPSLTPGSTAATRPIFRYYKFNTAAPPAPDAALSTPLSAGDRALVARIAVNFAVRPSRSPASAEPAVVVQDDVYVRSADPNDSSPSPQCV